MTRNQGVVAAAIVFAGMVMRPAIQPGSGIDASNSIQKSKTQSAQSTFGALGDGPWRASCNYWKPGLSRDTKSGTKGTVEAVGSSELKISVTEIADHFDSHISGSSDKPDTMCGKGGWGITKDTAPNITAIIATVPDPMRSATPWEFDRTIEVLMQAAAQYGYMESYFWLPWQRAAGEKDPEASPDSNAQSVRERERLPGLLILKQSSAVPRQSKADAPSNENGVLYLFLVGQSPALGVNADELQNAISYELDLWKNHRVRLSFKSELARGIRQRPEKLEAPSRLDIIGPDYSGAAASLRAALEGQSGIPFNLAGATSTSTADDTLSDPKRTPPIRYISFGDDTDLEERIICHDFGSEDHGKHQGRHLAFLTETGTLFGSSEGLKGQNEDGSKPRDTDACPARTVVHFPRNISLLRNAEGENAAGAEPVAPTPVGPYMRLSLKDSSTEDGVPPFSTGVTPYSQEAQWMSIVRQLRQDKANTIVVSATNSLDELFLVKLLYRDVPDARVIIDDGGDLLFARVGDDEAYLGTVTIAAYPLIGLSSTTDPTNGDPASNLLAFADSSTEILFNAAVFTFWDGKDLKDLHLAGYSLVDNKRGLQPPPLWATAVGRDGYYPLAILNPCASEKRDILPALASESGSHTCSSLDVDLTVFRNLHGSPAFSWYFICVAISGICIIHAVFLLVANIWSPLTRDLAIQENDQPRRRAVYLHIAGATLFCMSMISVIPMATTWGKLHPETHTIFIALLCLVSGLFAVCATLIKTRGYRSFGCEEQATNDVLSVEKRVGAQRNMRQDAEMYPFFNIIAAGAAIFIPFLWWYLCSDPWNLRSSSGASYAGLFFGYRCLYPASGVCPLIPVLLIFLTWYVWASMQSRRLRFSENQRPFLPGRSITTELSLSYVADETLSSCSSPTDSCLFANIECLLITREFIRRHLHRGEKHLNTFLALLYFVLFVCFAVFLRVEGLGNFLRPLLHNASAYEFLISAIFFPLLGISISGCVRLVAIWTSLSRGLLEPMERSPLRFAFSRLTNVAWTTMLRQSGLFEYWLDLARSVESMQQLVTLDTLWAHQNGVKCPGSAARDALESVRRHISLLVMEIPRADTITDSEADRGPSCLKECLDTFRENAYLPKENTPDPESRNFLLKCDLPCEKKRRVLNLMCALEDDCARFADLLLHCVLAPYWFTKRHSFVESELPIASGYEAKEEKATASLPEPPQDIYLAEEFVVIRYVSLIRAILINLRLLATFVSVAFVLVLLAWNSYPFQPKRWVDWTFTILLFGFGAVVLWVFAQMHRNAILSRITGTKANQLGADFYFRIVAYGAVPVLTWVGSQFPAVSNAVSKLLQSGFALAK
jgi:hypothetical protein